MGTRLGQVISLGVVVLLSSTSASANNNIITEAVNTYNACGFTSLSYSLSTAADLGWGLAGTGFLNYAMRYEESSVWTTDFGDPDWTLYTPDNDTTYFDNANIAFSAYFGHGSTGANVDGGTNIPCAYDGQCGGPPPTGICQGQAQNPAFCARAPGYTTGYCVWTCNRRRLQLGNGQCSQFPRYGQVAFGSGYGQSAKWGESPDAPYWGGAGINGGTNVVLLHASAAELNYRSQEVWGAMAGVQLLLTTTCQGGGDLSDDYLIGGLMANEASAPFTPVADSWLYTMNSNTATYYPCTGPGVWEYGKGFNGCGSLKAMASGINPYEASGRLNLNWIDITNDANDAVSGNYFSWRYKCNYDCNTWSFNLP